MPCHQHNCRLCQDHEDNELFNPGWLEDESEHIVLETAGSVITPLCRQPGRIVVTPARLYFQPFNVVSDAPLQVFDLSKARTSPCPACRDSGLVVPCQGS